MALGDKLSSPFGTTSDWSYIQPTQTKTASQTQGQTTQSGESVMSPEASNQVANNPNNMQESGFTNRTPISPTPRTSGGDSMSQVVAPAQVQNAEKQALFSSGVTRQQYAGESPTFEPIPAPPPSTELPGQKLAQELQTSANQVGGSRDNMGGPSTIQTPPTGDFGTFVNQYLNQRDPTTGMYYTMDQVAQKSGIDPKQLQNYLDYAQQANLNSVQGGADPLSSGALQEMFSHGQMPDFGLNPGDVGSPVGMYGAGALGAGFGAEGATGRSFGGGTSTSSSGISRTPGGVAAPGPGTSGGGMPATGGTGAQGPGASGGGITPTGAPQKVDYYNATGGKYGGEGESFWYNPADKIWYKGDLNGKITPVGANPPWQMGGPGGGAGGGGGDGGNGGGGGGGGEQNKDFNNPLGWNLNEFLKNYVNFPGDQQRIQDSMLTEKLRGAQSTDKQRLSEDLLNSGVGGAYSDAILSGLDRDYSYNLSQGLQNNAAEAIKLKTGVLGNALSSLLTGRNQDISSSLGFGNLSLDQQRLMLDSLLGQQQGQLGGQQNKNQLLNIILQFVNNGGELDQSIIEWMQKNFGDYSNWEV